MNTFLKTKLLAAVGALCFAVFSANAFAELMDTTTQVAPREFSHQETGFPLTGGHLSTECGACHVGGMFKGTPRNCAGCHARGSRVVATTMSINHIVTNDPCEICHTSTATFLGARFNHGNAQHNSCVTCHNGRVTTGKPASHNNGLRMTDSCESCHRTVSWYPAQFNHVGILPGTCAAQCHNGSLAIGKPASHQSVLKATSTCDTCHRFAAWLPTFYNHAAVVPGTCSNCHNGSSATGRPANHTGARLSMACDSCHNTASWFPGTYNHIGIAPGTCLTCHLAQRPTSHLARLPVPGYVWSCDVCHYISPTWATFIHANQQNLHTCNNCHSRRDHHGSGTQSCDTAGCHTVNGWGG